MGQLGMGAMISLLSGNEDSVNTFKAALGKTILSLELKDAGGKWSDDVHDRLDMHFTDRTGIQFFDSAQSCCESRYMRTDDELTQFVGEVLVGAEIRDAPSLKTQWGDEHDVQFLVIQTDKGSFTISSHNEHNGYYGGFSICVRALGDEKA